MEYKTNLQTLAEKMRSGNPSDRKKYISTLIEEGRRAQDLQRFLDDWLTITKKSVLDRLEAGDDDVNMIQADYKAALSLYSYIESIIAIAERQRVREENKA